MDIFSQVILSETDTILTAPQEKPVAVSNKNKVWEVESYFPGHPAILILFQEILDQNTHSFT